MTNNRKDTLINLLAVCSVFLIYILSGLIFKGNHKWMLLFTLSGTFIASYIFFKYNPFTSHLLKSWMLISLPPTLILFLFSLPAGYFLLTITYIIFIPLVGVLGCLFAKKKSGIILILGVIVILFSSFIYFPNQFIYFSNNNSRAGIGNKSPLTLINKNKDTIKFDNSKTIVLDFWTTSCGVCFKKFPDFEKVYLKYQNDPNIQIYSVNVPLKRDTLKNTIKLVDRLDYKFPTLYVSEPYDKDDLKKLGILYYPHAIIIKNNVIEYSGKLESDPLIIINNINSEIERISKNKK